MALQERFRIGDWLVEAQSHRLIRAGHPEHSVRIEPKAMQVLVYLARHAGLVVQKDQVVQEVWEGTFVTDEVLTNAVWELRKALGDDPKNPKFIETIPRKGYRLVAAVRPVDETEPPLEKELGGPSQARARARVLPWILLGLGLTIVFLTVWYGGKRGTGVSRPVARFRIDLDEPLAAPYLPATALSPDGSRLVYVADRGDGTTEFYLRAIDRMESSPIPGTRGGHGPFFSTDGRLIYSREGVPMAASFDADRLELSGTAVPVLEWIQWFPVSGAAQFDLSGNGSLAYVPGDGQWERP
jgi:DNA-binding winged helix-turn-helix (wHTH) protein